MSNTVDKIFAEVCLDERIKDGVFQLEQEEHMNALRDFFTKKGLTSEEATHITNRMVEGRFPERQAYNKDGILVTFPTPKHKAEAIQRGTHFEKNPVPQTAAQRQEPQPSNPSPEPKEPKKEVPDDDKEDEKDEKDEEPEDDEKSIGGGSGGPTQKVSQGDKQLDVEPVRGDEKPEPAPIPQSPTPPPAPRTPERIAAEKEVIKQILAKDDSALTDVATEVLQHQLNEILKKCNEWGFGEAEKFLKPHVK